MRAAIHNLVFFSIVVVGCSRPSSPSRDEHLAPPSAAGAPSPAATPPSSTVLDAAPPPSPSPPPTPAARGPLVIDGPHLLPLTPASALSARPIFYAFPSLDGGIPSAGAPPWRLIAHLHGTCGAPSYACGTWLRAGVEQGIVVCPTGNATCGDSPLGAPTWEAPSWPELVALMDRDLASSVARVEGRHPRSVRPEDAVLTGYSRGAYAAAAIAERRPGLWPYLVLIEANVRLEAAALRKAGVRSVALVAGEVGNEIAGMRKTEADLDMAGFPARLFVMKRTGHLYSEDIEDVMRDALAFVLSGAPDVRDH